MVVVLAVGSQGGRSLGKPWSWAVMPMIATEGALYLLLAGRVGGLATKSTAVALAVDVDAEMEVEVDRPW